MATTLLNTVLKATPKFRRSESQPSSREVNLPGLCSDAFAAWGTDHSADLSYRVELARRIALNFDNAEQIILVDDLGVVLPESERISFHGLRGCDRSLLPALWLGTGFRFGSIILVYTPPNPVEIQNYLKLKRLIEERLQREIKVRVFYEDEHGTLQELIELFKRDPSKYLQICRKFAERSPDDFYPEYHIDFLKKYFDQLTENVRCSLFFPYEMTEYHQDQLKCFSDRLKLPDLPVNDKAKHNLFLKSKGFNSLPIMIAVASDGTLIDNYEDYCRVVNNLDAFQMENNSDNIEKFAAGVIHGIDRLYQEYNVAAFVKLDASGAAGWSCMSPQSHSLLYDCDESEEKRLNYLCEYMKKKVIGEQLPKLAVVEEFIETEKRMGDIDADYTVCGFVLAGKFYPTSINLCGTIDGRYIEQWTSSAPADLNDSTIYWQRMYQTYSSMVGIEAAEFGYYNGIYAGDLFVTKDGRHKQRDWNIRRGGRSSPETLIIFGMPNYETKVTLPMEEFKLDKKLNGQELFEVYTQICQCLLDDYGMYVFSSGYGYCCQDDRAMDCLKFNILVHPKCLVGKDEKGETIKIKRSLHRLKVEEIIRATAIKVLEYRMSSS